MGGGDQGLRKWDRDGVVVQGVVAVQPKLDGGGRSGDDSRRPTVGPWEGDKGESAGVGGEGEGGAHEEPGGEGDLPQWMKGSEGGCGGRATRTDRARRVHRAGAAGEMGSRSGWSERTLEGPEVLFLRGVDRGFAGEGAAADFVLLAGIEEEGVGDGSCD